MKGHVDLCFDEINQDFEELVVKHIRRLYRHNAWIFSFILFFYVFAEHLLAWQPYYLIRIPFEKLRSASYDIYNILNLGIYLYVSLWNCFTSPIILGFGIGVLYGDWVYFSF